MTYTVVALFFRGLFENRCYPGATSEIFGVAWINDGSPPLSGWKPSGIDGVGAIHDAYGSPPDLDNEGDSMLYLGMLEQDIRLSITTDLAQQVSNAAQRIRTIDADPLRVA